AYHLDAAMDDLAPAVGDNTTFIPHLNGIKQIDVLQDRFGADNELGGTTYIGARVDAETGDIVHFGDFHRIAYGEMDGTMSDRVKAFGALNDVVKFDVDPRDDIEVTMWDKFAMLCAMSKRVMPRSVLCTYTGDSRSTPRNGRFSLAAHWARTSPDSVSSSTRM
ncbi:MAG: 2-dehydropantoate 2-reductase N-terminal domain-containing protein, partial [Alphaproteobacteria bacterium]